jgi:lipopolysaccharide/colanic/teichoic acid biosynthesis glycosyltransferase
VARLNLRRKTPSSHARLLPRVALWEIAWGGLSPVAAFLLRDGALVRPVGVATYCAVALVASLLVFQWFQTSSPISRFYSISDALELAKACVLIAALSAVAAFVLTRLDDAPRSIPILHLMLLMFGLLGLRMLLRLRETRRDTPPPDAADNAEHVLLIQASRLAWFFVKMMDEFASSRCQIVAILDERPDLMHRSLSGYPIVGAPIELEKIIVEYAAHGVRIDRVLLAAQPHEVSAAAFEEVCRVCRELRVGFEVLPERWIAGPPAVSEDESSAPRVEERPAAADAGLRPALVGPYWTVKRFADVVVALGFMIVTFPVALLVGALVLCDVGAPIVFWQRRVGRDGGPLYLYKFRTLQAPFDRRTKAKRNVREASALARFLRATRLDEWPQLWNVLSGEMSLIGPRPLLPIDQPTQSSFRLAVRPGVTGWAQVCGGRLISVDEKNALDEWYIRHASLRLDLAILARTVVMLPTGERRNEAAIAAALRERSRGEVTMIADLPEAAAAALPDDMIGKFGAVGS